MRDDLATASPSQGWVQRRERVMLELEHVALELFVEKGFDEVTYEDIAEGASLSWRTVYRYFPTKEAFLLAAPQRAASLYLAAVAETTRTGYPVDDYFDAIVALTDRYADDLSDVLLWARALQRAPADVANRVRGASNAMIEAVVIDLCAEGLDTHAGDVRATATAAAIAAVNQAVVESWIESGGEHDLRQLFEEALDGLRGSVRSRRRPR